MQVPGDELLNVDQTPESTHPPSPCSTEESTQPESSIISPAPPERVNELRFRSVTSPPGSPQPGMSPRRGVPPESEQPYTLQLSPRKKASNPTPSKLPELKRKFSDDQEQAAEAAKDVIVKVLAGEAAAQRDTIGLGLLPDDDHRIDTGTQQPYPHPRFNLSARQCAIYFAVTLMGAVFCAPYACLGAKFNNAHPDYSYTPVIAAALCNAAYPTAFLSAQQIMSAALDRKRASVGVFIAAAVSAYFLADTIIDDINYSQPLFWATFLPIRTGLHFLWIYNCLLNGLVPQVDNRCQKALLSVIFFPVAILMNTTLLIDAAKVFTQGWGDNQTLFTNIQDNPAASIGGLALIFPTPVFTMMSLMRVGFAIKSFCPDTLGRRFTRVRSDSSGGDDITNNQDGGRALVFANFIASVLALLSGTVAYQNSKDEVQDWWLPVFTATGAVLCNIYYMPNLVPKFASVVAMLYGSARGACAGFEKAKQTPSHSNEEHFDRIAATL